MLDIVFERFTEPARLVVVRAQEEARSLGHGYIGTEHMLLGLLTGPDTGAAQALGEAGMNLDAAREAVIEFVGRFEEPSEGQIPFTPGSKKLLEVAMRECLRLGHWHVGTEHLLLALLRVSEGFGRRVVLEAGVDLEALRAAVDGLLPPAISEASTHPARQRPHTPEVPRPVPPRLAAVPRTSRAVSFTVTPDAHTHDLLMEAGARALNDGRTEFTLPDLVAVLLSDHASIAQIIATINDREGGGN